MDMDAHLSEHIERLTPGVNISWPILKSFFQGFVACSKASIYKLSSKYWFELIVSLDLRDSRGAKGLGNLEYDTPCQVGLFTYSGRLINTG